MKSKPVTIKVTGPKGSAKGLILCMISSLVQEAGYCIVKAGKYKHPDGYWIEIVPASNHKK